MRTYREEGMEDERQELVVDEGVEGSLLGSRCELGRLRSLAREVTGDLLLRQEPVTVLQERQGTCKERARD